MTGARDLLHAYVATDAGDAASALAALPADEAARVLADMDPAAAATLVRHLSTAAAARCLDALDGAAVAGIGRELPLEHLAAVVRRLGDRGQHVLDGLEPETAGAVRRLLAYPDGTVGAVMDPGAPAVQARAAIGEVRAEVGRDAARVPKYVYAIDPDQALVGVVGVAALAEADPTAPVSTVTRAAVDWVRVEMPIGAALAHPGWHQYDMMPVVDGERRLVGVVRHRRLRQVAEDGPAERGEERAVRTLVALGEVYWLGLSGLLQGLAAAVDRPRPAGGKERP